jgi:hypothetical protein
LATTSAQRGRWLFPGLRLDSPLHVEPLRRRLRRLGITARPGRAAALMDLAKILPPAVVSDLLGISETCAAEWSRAASGDWARYAADASRTRTPLDEAVSAGAIGRRALRNVLLSPRDQNAEEVMFQRR